MATFASASLATLRPDIAGALMSFDLQANIDQMIGMRVFPVLEVDKPLGNWGKFTIAQLLQTRDDLRTPGADYNSGDGGLTPDTFLTQEHGFEEPVDDRESSMYSDYFDSEVVAAMRARHVVLQNLEANVITAALNVSTGAVPWTGGNGGTQTATNLWSDATNAKPIDDVTSALDQLYTQIGRRNASLVISWRRFNVLRNNAQIIDRVKYSGLVDPQREAITEAALAQALGVEELIVAGAVKNTAKEGKAATLGGLWTDGAAMLFIKPRTIDIREVAFGRTFHWAEDGSSIGAAIESYRWEKSRGNRVRARCDYQAKIVYKEAAVQLTV